MIYSIKITELRKFWLKNVLKGSDFVLDSSTSTTDMNFQQHSWELCSDNLVWRGSDSDSSGEMRRTDKTLSFFSSRFTWLTLFDRWQLCAALTFYDSRQLFRIRGGNFSSTRLSKRLQRMIIILHCSWQEFGINLTANTSKFI